FLDPETPMACYIYPDGKSSQWNEFEAKSIASIVKILQQRLGNTLLNEINNEEDIEEREPYTTKEFWKKGIGIVTPHRAQQALITMELQKHFSSNKEREDYVEPSLIRDAVDTVERFQGQQRDIIIASFALGDEDAIRNEEEFLTSLNRFNVMVSRARAKIIVFVSEEVVNHISNDLNVIRQSRMLKIFAELSCNQKKEMVLKYIDGDKKIKRIGVFRYRTF
ncbi:MAG: hypothetical protein GY870_21445, partial [archaeon]|nr:hypothetical protein [archaeon]